MTRFYRLSRTSPFAALALLAVCSASAQTVPTVPVSPLPAPSVVGKNAVLFQAQGSGVQIYTCKRNSSPAKAAPAYAWVLKAPEAVLLGSDGGKIGKHYAGPTWEAPDGSKAVGKLVASAAAPGTIPWLLLTATATGRGRFSKVTYVERVYTSGGAAPKTGADAAHAGTEVRVPYAATYIFYGPR